MEGSVLLYVLIVPRTSTPGGVGLLKNCSFADISQALKVSTLHAAPANDAIMCCNDIWLGPIGSAMQKE